MNSNIKNIKNDIANIISINNQTAIIVSSTFSTDENSITSLGGAVGTVQTTEDFNNLLNEATKQSHQNMQHQVPNLLGLEQAQIPEIQPINSIPQTAQNSPPNPMLKPSPQKTAYTKPHSTTLPASPKQQNLIQNLCNEKDKDINEILAHSGKELSGITSAEANEII